VLAWVRRVLEMEDCGKQRGGVLMAETRRVDEQLVFGLMGRKAYAQIGRRAFTYDEYGSELACRPAGAARQRFDIVNEGKIRICNFVDKLDPHIGLGFRGDELPGNQARLD
jgi:hypothetical protein